MTEMQFFSVSVCNDGEICPGYMIFVKRSPFKKLVLSFFGGLHGHLALLHSLFLSLFY